MKPFATFEQAAQIRDLLQRETGHAYRIEQATGKAGFVVCRTQSSNKHLGQTLQPQDSQNDPASTGIDIYHPALRSWLLQVPVLLLASAFVLVPDLMLDKTINAFGLSSLFNATIYHQVINGMSWIGLLLLGWTLLQIGYQYFASSLIIDQHGVTQKVGLIAQEIVTIRFIDIKTVGLKQGLVDRLLNLGLLELDSAGTDGIDIRFFNLARPRQLRDYIQSQLHRSASKQ